MTVEELTYRDAVPRDVPNLVALLADDALGAARERLEHPIPECYFQALGAITADPNNRLVVAELDGRLAGCLQLTYLPNLSHQGSWRAQIEGVRVHADLRGQGIGQQMFAWALAEAKVKGCRLVQLTSDLSRQEAIRFYEKLGFKQSHAGMKLVLDGTS